MPSGSTSPLVFWRETSKGRQGLVCRIDFCANPECHCEEALLQAFDVDEHYHGMVTRGSTLEILSVGPAKPAAHTQVSAVVDLTSGAIQETKPKPKPGAEAELMAWLRESIDEQTLAELRRRWAEFKEERKKEAEALARRTWRDRDWTEWDGEERVGWDEVAPGVTEDVYELFGRSYEAYDYYCVRPGCDCDSVAVRFLDTTADGEMVGEVLLEASSGKVFETNNRPGAHRTLFDLFSAYESRNDLGELSRRAERMLEIGPQIHALRHQQLRASTGGRSIGRNASCPCGSGKKYKKCCGA